MIPSTHVASPSRQRFRDSALNHQRTRPLFVFSHDDTGHDVVLDRAIKADVICIEDHMHIGLHQSHDGDAVGVDLDSRDRFFEVHVGHVVEHRSSPCVYSGALSPLSINKGQPAIRLVERQRAVAEQSVTSIPAIRFYEAAA